MSKLWRLLFSRQIVSGLLIFLEVLLIVCVLIGAAEFFNLFFVFAILLDLVAIVNIINRDANPEYKVTWSVLVLAMPILGAFLYATLYRRRITKKEERLLNGVFSQLNTHRLNSSSFDMMCRSSSLAAGKARAIMNDDPIAEVFTNSYSTFFSSGEQFFESLICDLKSAKEFIFLEYYIIDHGKLWDEIHDILKQKVNEGVEIRLLYDDLGCLTTMPNNYDRLLCSEGINARIFSKVSPKLSSVHNNRDHRKICVIDGKVGYTGGINIADEYANITQRFGHWKDSGIKLHGDAVRGMIKEFLASWDLTAGGVSDYGCYLSRVTPSPYNDGGYYLPFGSGPNPIYKRPVGKKALINLINQARNYIFITTPYLIIDYELTEALCNAALRGVDVRLITPGIPDKKYVKIMTQSSYPYLMKSGVKIYEYQCGFIHEKNVVVDDKYAVVGTINLDYRSFDHNFENAVWMYSSPTVLSVKEAFLDTQNKSESIDEKKCKLTLFEWIMRYGIRLFAPLL